jgi:hypothetical protein
VNLSTVVGVVSGAGITLLLFVIQQAVQWGKHAENQRNAEQWRVAHEHSDARRHEANVATMGRIEGKVESMMIFQGEVKATLSDHEREIIRLRDHE